MSGYYPAAALPLFEQPAEEEPAVHLARAEADDDGAWKDALREHLRALYLERKATWPLSWGEPFVCADDARAAMEKDPSLRPPPHRSNNALGSLFLPKGWVRIGDHISTTKGAHRNRIGRWAWVGDGA